MNNTEAQTNILLIGSGVIGSVYGAQFASASYKVDVLAHSTHENKLVSTDIRIRDIVTNCIEQVSVTVVRSSAHSLYELVIVAVQSNQLPSVFPALRNLKGQPNILFIGNNPEGHKAIPCDLPGTVQLSFPGISGAIKDGVVEYIHIAQQPTVLEMTNVPNKISIQDVLTSRHFPVKNVATIDGWLAYHAVFISCISIALIKSNVDSQQLANDHRLLDLMCRSIEQGFDMLRSQGYEGLPKNLAILHTPLLRPIAIYYWGSLLRSAKGELYFGAHVRYAQAEVSELAHWVLQQNRSKKGARHLQDLLGDA